MNRENVVIVAVVVLFLVGVVWAIGYLASVYGQT
jgi:hypothetical protein